MDGFEGNKQVIVLAATNRPDVLDPALLIFCDVSTGVSNDIEKATGIARSMVITYGMSDSLGPLMLGKGDSGFLGSSGESNPYSERTAEAIDAEVRGLLDAGMRQAEQLLVHHQDVLDALAARLLDDETIEGDDLELIFQGSAHTNGAVTPLASLRHRPAPGGPSVLPVPRVGPANAAPATDQRLSRRRTNAAPRSLAALSSVLSVLSRWRLRIREELFPARRGAAPFGTAPREAGEVGP
jgi:hypothetical protein